ncbi:MMPL family transporter [uncultured Roseibium sp.]|uniref:efflux RND transporter permease subunit n=1 Tax=uncultured Roseibium sp. TaxID=1936171 RepID=UPI00321803C8
MYFLLWPGHAALSRPVIVSIVLMILAGLSVFPVLNIRFENDITASFASSSGHAKAYFEFADTNGGPASPLLALVQSPEPLDAAGYELLRDLQFGYSLADGVDAVFSLASARFPPWHPDYPEEPLLPLELDVETVEARLAAYDALKLQPKLPVSADRTSALFLIETGKGVSADLLTELKQITEETAGDRFHVTFTGEETVGPEMVRALRQDLWIFNVAGVAVVLVVSFIVFGNLRLVVLAAVPSIAAAYTSLVVFVVLGLKITVLNNAIPLLVMVLGVADTVHLILNMRANANTSSDTARARARKALETVGPACALTGVTTSIAFSTIMISENVQTREMAVAGAVSVLVSYAVIVAVFCLLAPVLWPKKPGTRRRVLFALSKERVSWMLDHAGAIRACSLILAAAAFAGVFTVKPWFKMDDNLPADSALIYANDVITQEFGGFYQLWFELEAENGTGKGFASHSDWERLVHLNDLVEKEAPGNTVLSLVSLARWLGQPGRMPSPEEIADWPSDAKSLFLSGDGNRARVVALMPEPMFDKVTLEVQDRLVEAVRTGSSAHIFGQPMIMRYDTLELVRRNALGLGGACLITVLLIAGYYRAPVFIVLLLLPNLLPIAVAVAALHVLNASELTPAALLSLTIAFGIAVDDSIHFINRYMLERRRWPDTRSALAATMSETGQAMIITTVLISCGLLVTLASEFHTIRLFGGMLIATLLTALLGDLLLLPSLIAWRKGKV